MSALIRYEQARTALAECHRVDEVKDIRDKAEAMAAYARQARDTELILYATEIKVRAERKCGELLAVAERGAPGRPPANAEHAETNYQAALRENDLSRMAASRYQRLAAMPEEHFETAVATAKEHAGQVTTAFMLSEAKKHKPTGKPAKGAKADAMREELRAAKGRGVSMLGKNTRNRRVRNSHVETLRASFERGEYRVTHQGVAFDENGEMIDGQHRLIAISMLDGGVFPMLVTTGLPASAFSSIDATVAKRSAADALGENKRERVLATGTLSDLHA